MAYAPIARTLPQYVDSSGNPYSGAVLKAYSEGTSTTISFATDDTGGTTFATALLNASGYPTASGNPVLPYLNVDYKLALYPTQAAADANTGAIWTIDNIPLFSYDVAGNKLTSVGNGTARTDAVNVSQVQDGQFTYVGTTGGSADAYTITTSPTFTAYATTQRFVAKVHATNTTTTPYIQFNSISTPSTTAEIVKLNASKAEVAVEASDMLTNGIYEFQRNSGNDAWVLVNPESRPIINAQTTLTIASGVITATGSNHLVATEGAASTDNLDTVNGLVNGQIVVLQSSNSSQDVVITNSGNILTATGQDFTLETTTDKFIGQYRSSDSKLVEIARNRITPKYYSSGQQTITNAGALTLAHGLAKVPDLIVWQMQCTSSEHGYSTNDIVFANTMMGQTGSAVTYGVSIVPDATNLNVRMSDTTPRIMNKTNGAAADITLGSWKYIFKAYLLT